MQVRKGDQIRGVQVVELGVSSTLVSAIVSEIKTISGAGEVYN